MKEFKVDINIFIDEKWTEDEKEIALYKASKGAGTFINDYIANNDNGLEIDDRSKKYINDNPNLAIFYVYQGISPIVNALAKGDCKFSFDNTNLNSFISGITESSDEELNMFISQLNPTVENMEKLAKQAVHE